MPDARRRLVSAALLCVGLAAAAPFLAEGVLFVRGQPVHESYVGPWLLDDVVSRYVPRPGVYRDLFQADVRIDSLGLRGPELQRADVLLLGDSCTFGVEVPERETFAGLLTMGGFLCANAGVPGYNSSQGLGRYRSGPLAALRPRFVVIYFGWNDHWSAIAPESAFAWLRAHSGRSRVIASALRFQDSLSRGKTWQARLRWIPQVPLREYRSNLKEMIALARERGARPVLVTAAACPERISPAWSLLSDYRRYHAAYAEATRAVAVETGTDVVDFEREVAALDPQTRAGLFRDPVHLNAAGHRRLAAELLAVFKQPQAPLSRR